MGNFFEDNLVYIIAVALVILILILVFIAEGIDFNTNKHKRVRKIVTVEGFIDEHPEEPEKKKELRTNQKTLDKWIADDKMNDLKEYAKKISEKIAAGIEDGSHEAYLQSISPDDRCNNLSDNLCRKLNGCVHIHTVNGETSCALGDSSGPFKPSETPEEEYHYYHQEKCYGDTC